MTQQEYQQQGTAYQPQYSEKGAQSAMNVNQEGYQQQGMTYQPQYAEKGAHNTTTTTGTVASGWSNGFWDCFSPGSLCFMSCCCPCLVFGKTQSRNAGDPVPSSVGGNCLGWYCLACCGFSWVFQAIKRNEYRHKHGIEGSGVMDCLASACCACCSLIQEEKESLLREGQTSRVGVSGQGATPQQGYQQSPGMQY